MGLIEAPFGDLILALMQSPLMRWGVALAVSLWVWLVGDEDAVLRKPYLLAPFACAGVIELLDFAVLGASRTGDAQGGWLPLFLFATDGLNRLASPVGLGALVLALVLGLKRGIGFAVGLAVLLCGYFAEGMAVKEGKTLFSLGGLRLIAVLLPTILTVLMTFYGLGATARRIWEARNAPR